MINPDYINNILQAGLSIVFYIIAILSLVALIQAIVLLWMTYKYKKK